MLFVSIVFLDRVDHRYAVFDWREGLDIVDRVEDESASGSEGSAAFEYFKPDFFWRSKWKRLLGVNACSPEGDAITVLSLEPFRIHAFCEALDGN